MFVFCANQELVFTASLDSTIRVWGVQQTAPCAHVIRAHDGPVTGISLHATGDYLLSCSTDSVSVPPVMDTIENLQFILFLHVHLLIYMQSHIKCPK